MKKWELIAEFDPSNKPRKMKDPWHCLETHRKKAGWTEIGPVQNLTRYSYRFVGEPGMPRIETPEKVHMQQEGGRREVDEKNESDDSDLDCASHEGGKDDEEQASSLVQATGNGIQPERACAGRACAECPPGIPATEMSDGGAFAEVNVMSAHPDHVRSDALAADTIRWKSNQRAEERWWGVDDAAATDYVVGVDHTSEDGGGGARGDSARTSSSDGCHGSCSSKGTANVVPEACDKLAANRRLVRGRQRDSKPAREKGGQEFYQVGDAVEAQYVGNWYPGRVTKVLRRSRQPSQARLRSGFECDFSFVVHYFRPKFGRSEIVDLGCIRPCRDFDWCKDRTLKSLKVGDRVQARHKHEDGNKEWYAGTVTAASKTGTYTIEYTDDKIVETRVRRENIKNEDDLQNEDQRDTWLPPDKRPCCAGADCVYTDDVHFLEFSHPREMLERKGWVASAPCPPAPPVAVAAVGAVVPLSGCSASPPPDYDGVVAMEAAAAAQRQAQAGRPPPVAVPMAAPVSPSRASGGNGGSETGGSVLRMLSEVMDEAARDAEEAHKSAEHGSKAQAVDLYRAAAGKLHSLLDVYGADLGAGSLGDEVKARAKRYADSAQGMFNVLACGMS